MNALFLIDKYGVEANINGTIRKVYIDTQKGSLYKKSKFFTSFETIEILVKGTLGIEDKISIDDKDYLVFEIVDTPTINGVKQYTDAVCFVDDFINDIKIYTQTLNKAGCNLPIANEVPYKEVKARIRSKKPLDYLQYSLQGAKVPTHTITVFYDSEISASDLIEWGDRRFEILTLENIDERDRLLELNCIEVLNA